MIGWAIFARIRVSTWFQLSTLPASTGSHYVIRRSCFSHASSFCQKPVCSLVVVENQPLWNSAQHCFVSHLSRCDGRHDVKSGKGNQQSAMLFWFAGMFWLCAVDRNPARSSKRTKKPSSLRKKKKKKKKTYPVLKRGATGKTWTRRRGGFVVCPSQ